jgi:hypothetical protein
LKRAPAKLQIAKILLAENLSAHPDIEKIKVPKIKPACTLVVSKPTSPWSIPQTSFKLSAALLALNHSDVPHN